MKRSVCAAILVVGIFAIAIAAYVYTGQYDVGADTPHWAVTFKALEIVRNRSIATRARNIAVPNLSDPQLVLKGAGQYAAMCVNCHLAPGLENSEIRPGLYPQPPNLSKVRLDPRVAFWVTKHGLKMSAMPAWGLGHDDAALWSIIAFVTKLPDLSEQEYKDIVAKAPVDKEMEAMPSGQNSKRETKQDRAYPNGGSSMKDMPGMR